MRVLVTFLLCLIGFVAQGQYAFELKVDYSAQIGNTENYSVSGTLIKGKIEKGKKYYLTTGAELQVVNLMSATTTTSVSKAQAPDKVSLGLIAKKFIAQQNVILKGISTQPSYGNETVRVYENQIPEGAMEVKINGMMFKARQISKPIRTKQSDILDMFYKTKSGSVFWLQIGNLRKIEKMPLRIVSDSTFIGTDKPYCKIVFMPDGFLPTQLPNNYKGYEEKFGKSSILLTRLKKYTFQATLEFGGRLFPNWKLKEENEMAQPIELTNGRVDKIIWEEH